MRWKRRRHRVWRWNTVARVWRGGLTTPEVGLDSAVGPRAAVPLVVEMDGVHVVRAGREGVHVRRRAREGRIEKRYLTILGGDLRPRALERGNARKQCRVIWAFIVRSRHAVACRKYLVVVSTIPNRSHFGLEVVDHRLDPRLHGRLRHCATRREQVVTADADPHVREGRAARDGFSYLGRGPLRGGCSPFSPVHHRGAIAIGCQRLARIGSGRITNHEDGRLSACEAGDCEEGSGAQGAHVQYSELF